MRSSCWMQSKHTGGQIVSQRSRNNLKKIFQAKFELNPVVRGDVVCQQQGTLGQLEGRSLESHKLVPDSIDQPTCSDRQGKSVRLSSSGVEMSEEYGAVISVCMGKHCSKRGSKDVMQALTRSAKEFPDSIEVACTSCLGQCKRGPSVHVKMSTGEEVMCVRVDEQNSIRQLTLAALDDVSWAL